MLYSCILVRPSLVYLCFYQPTSHPMRGPSSSARPVIKVSKRDDVETRLTALYRFGKAVRYPHGARRNPRTAYGRFTRPLLESNAKCYA